MSIEDNGYYVRMSIYKKYTFMYVYGVGGALKRWTLLYHLMKRYQTLSMNKMLAKYYILF